SITRLEGSRWRVRAPSQAARLYKESQICVQTVRNPPPVDPAPIHTGGGAGTSVFRDLRPLSRRAGESRDRPRDDHRHSQTRSSFLYGALDRAGVRTHGMVDGGALSGGRGYQRGWSRVYRLAL